MAEAKGNEVRGVVVRVLIAAAILAVAAAAIAAIFSTARSAASVGAGAGLGMLSFAALVAAVSGSYGSGRSRLRAGLLAGLGMVKLAIIGGLLWWLISRSIVDPFTLLIGFSAVVAALVFEGLRTAMMNRGAKA